MQQERPQRPLRRRRSAESVQQYRLYFLEGVERRFSRSHEFEAKDDEAAISIAQSWLEGRPAELWCRERKVKSWESRG